MLKYIIFDFDGTLVDSKEIAVKAFNDLAEKYGYNKVDKKEFDYLKKLTVLERSKYLNAPIYRIPFWSADFYNLYKQSINKLNFFDGIENLLNELNTKGYNIGIISSNAEDNIRSYLKIKNLDYIKDVYCSNKIFSKDKIIKKFLKKNQLKKTEVIYIGDEHRDIIASKKAGIEVIWVEWGFDLEEIIKDAKPDYIAKDPDAILKIVLEKSK